LNCQDIVLSLQEVGHTESSGVVRRSWS